MPEERSDGKTKDGAVYVHFLPGQEAMAAGTPWIVHSRGGALDPPPCQG